MYSLPITGNFTALRSYAYDSVDYQVLPVTNWSFALDVDPSNPAASLTYTATGYQVFTLLLLVGCLTANQPGTAPFNHTNTPVTIRATARYISWPEEKSSAAAPPASPACKQQTCGPPQPVELIPYGSTYLRITEIPYA